MGQGSNPLLSSLRRAGFIGNLTADAPLAGLTTWRIGGPAELLAVPRDSADLQRALAWAASESVPWRVMGNGSNLLVSDRGVPGLVLRVRRVLDGVRREDRRLHVGAGASLPGVTRRACAGGLAGIEFGAGIPGTVGGAVIMNAGWHQHEIGNAIVSVEYLEGDGTIRTYGREECRFGYRHSLFRGRRGVVLSATLELRREEPRELLRSLERYAESRRMNQPTELPSCGSVFLKPAGDFAGRLIERAGLKGLRVGGLEVSSLHANFFVNLGGGTCADALRLVQRVEDTVQRKFGVRLEREFELWS